MPEQAEIVTFLSSPSAYGEGIADVERHETHGAIVFLAGDKAYKLKRAVRYPYMDYSSLELRRQSCEAELIVNRRTAPQLYLETRAIVQREDGRLAFGRPGDFGRARDWVVVMRRFDQSALLSRLSESGGLTEAMVRDLAETVAEFHAGAEEKPVDGADAIAAVVGENASILRTFENAPFVADKVARYDALSRDALERWRVLLGRRGRTGFVRRCHGDLHLNNICLLDGRPVLFDAIEFNEKFSVIDTLYDFAFLLMDLEHRGQHALANAALNRYLERSDDYEGTALLPLFLSCRAAIRAHVMATFATRANAGEAAGARADAVRFLDDAIALLALRPAWLLALGGVSGTGKSTLARRVAQSFGATPGAIVLRSDVLRKRLWKTAETDRLPDEAYTRAANENVYRALRERVAFVLAGGHCAIADAVFGRDEERRFIGAAAADQHSRFFGVWLEAATGILEARISARRGDASDATAGVLQKQLDSIVPPADWVHIDAGRSAGAVLDDLLTALPGEMVSGS